MWQECIIKYSISLATKNKIFANNWETIQLQFDKRTKTVPLE